MTTGFIENGLQGHLQKYYDDRRWAEAFLNGEILFRSLSYFRDYEDENIRRDRSEGTSLFQPENGLVINNLSQGTKFTLPDHSFQSSAKADEIFIFCASRSHSDERYKKFGAVARVEILDIASLCGRVKRALPADAVLRGQPVAYYSAAENPTPRWAFPEQIATSKLADYAWQEEFRVVFSLTGALGFEKVEPRLVQTDARRRQRHTMHQPYLLKVGCLSDICRLLEH